MNLSHYLRLLYVPIFPVQGSTSDVRSKVGPGAVTIKWNFEGEISLLTVSDKELIVSKEKLQADFSAQKTTIQEQRGTIEVLDNALRKTHAIVTKYEEEVSQPVSK